MDRNTAKILVVASLALVIGGYFGDLFGLMMLGAGMGLTLNFVDIK